MVTLSNIRHKRQIKYSLKTMNTYISERFNKEFISKTCVFRSFKFLGWTKNMVLVIKKLQGIKGCPSRNITLYMIYIFKNQPKVWVTYPRKIVFVFDFDCFTAFTWCLYIKKGKILEFLFMLIKDFSWILAIVEGGNLHHLWV